MNSRASAEQLALVALLLTVVEVQNICRRVNQATSGADSFDAFAELSQLVESPTTIEHIQLARAALETPVQRAVPADVAEVHP